MTERLTEKITYGKKNKKTNQPIIKSLNMIEIIHHDNLSTIVDSENAFLQELNQEIPLIRQTNSNRICVLDLHNTLDVLTINEINIQKLKTFKSKYSLVVALSFVGKADGEGSTRYNARMELIQNIKNDIIDFGILVFKREFAKGIICDLLLQKFNNIDQIIFSDDGDDHIEAVKDIIGNGKKHKHKDKQLLGSIHKSDPTKPDDLMNWLDKEHQL